MDERDTGWPIASTRSFCDIVLHVLQRRILFSDFVGENFDQVVKTQAWKQLENKLAVVLMAFAAKGA